MPNDRSEKHLDVYEDRYELHQGGGNHRILPRVSK